MKENELLPKSTRPSFSQSKLSKLELIEDSKLKDYMKATDKFWRRLFDTYHLKAYTQYKGQFDDLTERR